MVVEENSSFDEQNEAIWGEFDEEFRRLWRYAPILSDDKSNESINKDIWMIFKQKNDRIFIGFII